MAGFSPVAAQVIFHQLSSDPFTNTASQHATAVEPDIFSYGSTTVAAFQIGRTFSGGSAAIGFATSTDNGATWTSGVLPGITRTPDPSNPYDLASDPSVTYDAAHGVWLIASLPIVNSAAAVPAVVVSRSADALHWDTPIGIEAAGSSDKPWIICDNTASSQFYGHCYAEWDDFNANGVIHMSASADGGLTWGPALNTADSAAGIGGQPLVQPNGTVVVPIGDGSLTSIEAFLSTNGGASWGPIITIAFITEHVEAGGLRSGPLPTAAIDSAGAIRVVWADCRYRAACASNDLVMSSSPDGETWTSPVRIPIDAVSSTADYFIPGLAADPGSNDLGLTYYYYPESNCTVATCLLNVGFVHSADGGETWSAPVHLAGPMLLSWLPNTSDGRMVGDYIATSYAAGKAVGVFATAGPVSAAGVFQEAIYAAEVGVRTPGAGWIFGATHRVHLPEPPPNNELAR